MSLLGKGYFLWQVPRCDGGDPAAIAARARAASLSHVLIKIADGGYWDYNYDKEKDIDLVPPVRDALKAEGIQVWGWHYVRGDQPIAEARKAIQRVRQLNVDGYVIDAESEYRDRSRWNAARAFVGELSKGLPEIPVALSSYRYPKVHRDLPYEIFLEICDYAMPQVYFEQKHNPEEQLERSVAQYLDLQPARPVIPTAPTYARGSWRPTPVEIQRFLDKARSIGLSAANAWSWDFATRPEYLDLWGAVADFAWPASDKPPVADMPERLIGRLNQWDPAHVAGLYADRAAHVTGERTLFGKASVETWYRTLLNELLPKAEFSVTGKGVSGDTRQFTWTATSEAGQVLDGKDTLSVRDGRILYHYTYFHIQPAPA